MSVLSGENKAQTAVIAPQKQKLMQNSSPEALSTVFILTGMKAAADIITASAMLISADKTKLIGGMRSIIENIPPSAAAKSIFILPALSDIICFTDISII